MAGFRRLIKPSAAKEIEAIGPKRDRQRIVARILALAAEPRPVGYEKLAGVAPGAHQVTIQGPVPRPGGGYLKSFTLDAEPCKRYYINAQFKNRIDVDFEPLIDYVEGISGCVVASSK